MAGDEKYKVKIVSTEDILSDYDNFYARHWFQPFSDVASINSHQLLERAAWVRDYAIDHKPMSLLDLGCLDGYIGHTLANVGVRRVVGVDLSKDGVKLANEKAARLGIKDKCQFIQGSIESYFEHSDEQFDMITLFEVLEHVKEPETVLKRMLERLTPQGRAFISTPDWEGEFGKEDAPHNHAHLRIYTHREEDYDGAPSLPQLVKKIGGKVDENEVWNSLIHLRYGK